MFKRSGKIPILTYLRPDQFNGLLAVKKKKYAQVEKWRSLLVRIAIDEYLEREKVSHAEIHHAR